MKRSNPHKWSLVKAFFCWTFHQRWRKPTGERWIGRINIEKLGKCAKCGHEYAETTWFTGRD